jgi:hypothetical protein
MYWVAILAAVLLVPLATAQESVSDPADRVSGGDSAQAGSASVDNPEKPEADPLPPDGDEAKQSEIKKEETPSDKKAEETHPQKAPSGQPATGVRKHRSRTKKPAPLTADGEPRKIVIHRGGTSEPVTQILPGLTQEEARHQRESAEQLLAAAESSLKELSTRSLNPNHDVVVVQIRQYMDVARSALNESDTQRAHTLALKAYLLSDDLVKHQGH